MRVQKKIIFLILVTLSLFLSFNSLLIKSYGYEVDETGRVYNIVDGDTVDVTSVGRIRLADIDAPDTGEPGKVEATNYISSLIYDKTVYVDVDDVYGTDVYGRVVAVLYVYYDANHVKNVNKAMLDSGHATIWNFDNEFNPYSWNLIELFPPSGYTPPPTPDPPPDDPPSDGNPTNPNPALAIVLVVSIVGVGGGAIAYVYYKPSKFNKPKYTNQKHHQAWKSYHSKQISLVKMNNIQVATHSSLSNIKLIKDITVSSKNLNLNGTVVKVNNIKEFLRKNGTKGKVGSFLLSDSSGIIRVVLWDENSEIINTGLIAGKIVSVLNGYSKLNTFQGKNILEVHISKYGKVLIN